MLVLLFLPRDDGNILTAGHESPGLDHRCKPFSTFSASLKMKGTTMKSEAGLLF